MIRERSRLLQVSCLALLLQWAGSSLAAERLVMISPHWEGLRIEYARAFSDWHRANYGEPVEFDWRDLGGTSDDLKFVVSEFAQRPDGIGIDLFFGGGIDPFYDLAKRGLLQAYRPPDEILSRIPKDVGGVPIYDPEFRWFGAALSSFGILYNKRVLEVNGLPVLETWRDLAERAPVGMVGSGDPRNSGTIHMVYEIILQRYGWADGWAVITRLAAKLRGFDRTASTTAKEVMMGNTGYAMAVDFYALTQIAYAGRANMGFVLPRDCTTINPDGLAILRGAPHPETAQRFVEFVISEPGQKLLMLPRGAPGGSREFSIERMCILPELYRQYRDVTLVPINPFTQTFSFHYDPRKGSARWDLLNGLIGATIIDVHPELVAAWRRIAGAGTDSAAVTRFAQPPINEAEAMRLAGAEWRDPRFRQRRLIEWQQWARTKFGSIP